MSLSAAILIFMVFIIRQLAIHRLPKRAFVIFWCVVLVRLLIPFSVTLPLPIDFYLGAAATDAEVVTGSTSGSYTEMITDGIAELYSDTEADSITRPSYMGTEVSDATMRYAYAVTGDAMWHYADAIAGNAVGLLTGANQLPYLDFFSGILSSIRMLSVIYTFNATLLTLPNDIPMTFPIAVIWIIGMSLAALFFLVTHFRARKVYSESLPVDCDCVNQWLSRQGGIRRIQARQSDRITAPLTYGLLKPVILFPKTTDWRDTANLQYILAHEMSHIRQLDILVKWLLAAALCIHWFNPLVWAMYVLANRDIELACDETVVTIFGETAKPDYAMVLVGLEERRSVYSPLNAGFAKNSVEERIVAIMKLKKRSVMSMIFTVILVSALAVGALTVFASSNTPEYRPFDPYDIPCDNYYVEAISARSYDKYVEAVLADEDDRPIADYYVVEEGCIYILLTDTIQCLLECEISPYRIARTIEEVMAIIALQDDPIFLEHYFPGELVISARPDRILHPGTIPVTNLQIPEIINRQALGIIATEQCLYELLGILNENFWLHRESGALYGHANVIHMVTTRLHPPMPIEELQAIAYARENRIKNIWDFLDEINQAAIADGLLEGGSGIYQDDFDLMREEALRMFDTYGYSADNWPSSERAHEAAQRLFGG